MADYYMLWVWLGVFVVAFVVEAATQELVSIWVALGALVALPFAFIKDYFWISIIVFILVTIISLIATRPFVNKILKVRKTNTDEFIGKRLKVIEEIDKYNGGLVKLNGIEYKAILLEDESDTISVDSIVEVKAINGNKLIVKEVKEENKNIERM